MRHTPAIALTAALACSAGTASAELIELTVSGVVTDVLVSHGSGAYSDLSVGDTWTYTMVVREGYAQRDPSMFEDGFWLPTWYWNVPFTFVSASFVADGTTLAVTARDLFTLNGGAPTSSSSFDFHLSSSRPTQDDDGLIISIPFNPALQFGPSGDFIQLEMFLPSVRSLVDPSVDVRWATFDLEGGRFAGLITDYSYGPSSGRAVPTPGVPALLLTAGFAAARRRR